MEVNRYHKLLRVSALVTAFVLVFDGGFIAPVTKELSNATYVYLATVGSSVSLSVPPNELNQITAELTRRQQELDARESALNKREIGTRDFSLGEDTDYSTYILSIILFILMVLILLNYALDWVRARQRFYEGQNT